MWFRCTSRNQPVIINAERVLKIVEKTGERDAGGCLLYISLSEYLTVDQTLDQMMMHLGFEDRG
jgi:hypothetical protein